MHFCRVKAHGGGTRHNWAEKLSYFVTRLLFYPYLQAMCFPSTISALVLSFTLLGNWPRSKNDYWQAIITLPPSSPPFLLCFSSPLLSLIWRRQIQFLSSFYSPTMCGSKHLHIIDIFMECQDRAYITLQKAQRQSREFLYINLLYKKVSRLQNWKRNSLLND